jgi:hypothetical protein
MWDYVTQIRRDEFHREAAALRLVRLARVERPSRIRQLWSALRSQITPRLASPENRTIYPKAQTQEMQPCVDA